MAKESSGRTAPGNGTVEIPVIDPATIGTAAASNDAGSSGSAGTADAGGNGSPRKRGRKPGTASKTKTKNSDAVGLEKILFSIHAMAAAALGEPVLALDEQESKLLANAVAEVNEHYNFGVDPKVMAWASLAGVAASIYAPRFMVIYKSKKKSEKEKEKAQALTESQTSTLPGA